MWESSKAVLSRLSWLIGVPFCSMWILGSVFHSVHRGHWHSHRGCTESLKPHWMTYLELTVLTTLSSTHKHGMSLHYWGCSSVISINGVLSFSVWKSGTSLVRFCLKHCILFYTTLQELVSSFPLQAVHCQGIEIGKKAQRAWRGQKQAASFYIWSV